MTASGDECAKQARCGDVGDPLPYDELEMAELEEDDDGDKSDAGEAEAADDARPVLVASDYGPNTPTSKGARRVSHETKGTWASIKRIKAKGPREVLGANSAGDLRRVSNVTYFTLLLQSPSAPMLYQPSVRLR